MDGRPTVRVWLSLFLCCVVYKPRQNRNVLNVQPSSHSCLSKHDLVLDCLCLRIRRACPRFGNQASGYHHPQHLADRCVLSIHELRERGVLQPIHDDQLELRRYVA